VVVGCEKRGKRKEQGVSNELHTMQIVLPCHFISDSFFLYLLLSQLGKYTQLLAQGASRLRQFCYSVDLDPAALLPKSLPSHTSPHMPAIAALRAMHKPVQHMTGAPSSSI
jgi:hypothetical protein